METPALSGGIESYIRLVMLFSVFVTALMILLCYLYLSIRKARKQEQLSYDFSGMVIDGLETERRRISRELHDAVLPQLYGRAVSDQIRSICTNLMPPDFSCLSLKDALAQYCVQFSGRTKIQCAFFIEDNIDFSPYSAEDQLHIFRMIQESFNNIEKHSKADRASLTIRRCLSGSSGNILICVSDDGVGLSGITYSETSGTVSGKATGEGLGMRSIRQRAVIIGAKLDFISETGNGLMVRIDLYPPLNGH